MSTDHGQRVDYDQIAHLYDEPLRDHEVDPHLIEFLNERLDLAYPQVLDMGCGTGKQLQANEQAFEGLTLVGVDLFLGMLRQAQARSGSVAWIQGNSAQPPFASSSFDYITNQFSYPHVLDKGSMIAEAFRLLAPGGRFVMTNIDPWHMRNWILYQFFPTARERDFEDFLPAERFIELMEEVGFTHIQATRHQRAITEKLSEFLEYVSQRFRTSQLMMIRDSDYEAGLADLRHALRVLGERAQVTSEFCLLTIRGDKG